MKTPEEAYKLFIKKYPNVFDRRDAISVWCIKCQDYYRLSREIWKLLDMFEDEKDV